MKNKVKLMVVVLLIVLLVMNTIVLATSEPTLKLNASKTSVKTGEEFTVTVSQEFEDGAMGLICDLKYDNNVLEFKNCKSLSDWFCSVEDDEEYGQVLNGMIASDDSQKKGDVCELTFKVKDNYTEKSETKVELTTNDFVDMEDNTITAKDIGITIKVNESSDSQEPTNTPVENTTTNITPIDNTQSNNNTSTNNTTNNTSKNNTANNTSKNNTTNNTSKNNTTNNTSKNNTANNTSKNNTANNNTNNSSKNNTANNTTSSLPKTGSERGYTLLIIVGLAGVAYASYMGYKKYKDI